MSVCGYIPDMQCPTCIAHVYMYCCTELIVGTVNTVCNSILQIVSDKMWYFFNVNCNVYICKFKLKYLVWNNNASKCA
jgi:hypothetical protein